MHDPHPTHPSLRRTSGLSRVAVVATISLVVVGIGVAIALPRFMSADSEETELPPVAASAPVAARAEPAAAKPAEAAPAPVIATSAEGDLVLELKLRWSEVVSGSTLPAAVRCVNTGLKPFELPAPGEPHPTLALVVLDAEGHEVRRVVETGPDAYPRRTATVQSGSAMELPVRVLAGDDAALEPGTYTVYAEMRMDPAWSRLGIPLWTAPNGPVRSAQETLTITARPE